MYSAVRVGGRRLHEAARAGERVDRAPRRVRIHALELLAFHPAPPGGSAQARVAVRCGKGTYVRTLAADLGEVLGVPAHLAALRRTAAGPFTIEGATPLATVEELALRDPAALRALVAPVEEAVRSMPSVRLDAAQARDVSHGRPVALAGPAPLFAALAPDGRLLALCQPSAEGARPVRVFAGASSR
jgi:tRNA pseudouridine55 synthase